MRPLSEILLLLRTTTAQSFADRHPNQDLVLLEPYEKGRSYDQSAPLHSGGQVTFLPKTAGRPVPVGRDARSVVLLDHPAVSRLHLVIAYTDQGWKVMDRSSNGSWLNEVRMTKEQAVPLQYGTPVRMGRAMILRMFTLAGFHSYARGATQGQAPVAPSPSASDPQADTWRFPQAAAGAAAPPPGPAAPTQQYNYQQRPAPPAAPAPPTPPQRPSAPVPPAPVPPPSQPGFDIDFEFNPAGGGPAAPSPPRPAAPRKTVKGEDGMEFDFDFDFESDNRGGFA
jgi:hypothetical protein